MERDIKYQLNDIKHINRAWRMINGTLKTLKKAKKHKESGLIPADRYAVYVEQAQRIIAQSAAGLMEAACGIAGADDRDREQMAHRLAKHLTR